MADLLTDGQALLIKLYGFIQPSSSTSPGDQGQSTQGFAYAVPVANLLKEGQALLIIMFRLAILPYPEGIPAQIVKQKSHSRHIFNLPQQLEAVLIITLSCEIIP